MLPAPYYHDACVTLYHGDANVVLPGLPAPDLLLTDPPHEMELGGNGGCLDRAYLKDIKRTGLHVGFNPRLLAPFDNWAVFCAKAQLAGLIEAAGGRNWCLVTWNKPNPPPMVNRTYLSDAEYIVHAWRPGRLFGDVRDRSRFIVYSIERNEWSHPTVKPLPVVAKMMRLGSEEGDLILDPFAGTGSTLVAAKLRGAGPSASRLKSVTARVRRADSRKRSSRSRRGHKGCWRSRRSW